VAIGRVLTKWRTIRIGKRLGRKGGAPNHGPCYQPGKNKYALYNPSLTKEDGRDPAFARPAPPYLRAQAKY